MSYQNSSFACRAPQLPTPMPPVPNVASRSSMCRTTSSATAASRCSRPSCVPTITCSCYCSTTTTLRSVAGRRCTRCLRATRRSATRPSRGPTTTAHWRSCPSLSTPICATFSPTFNARWHETARAPVHCRATLVSCTRTEVARCSRCRTALRCRSPRYRSTCQPSPPRIRPSSRSTTKPTATARPSSSSSNSRTLLPSTRRAALACVTRSLPPPTQALPASQPPHRSLLLRLPRRRHQGPHRPHCTHH